MSQATAPPLSSRRYLKALIEHQGVAAGGTEKVARAFGMSASLLKMILSGHRKLQIDQVHKIAVALRLSTSEIERFECLVLYEQCRGPESKRFYKKRLSEMARTGVNQRTTTARALLDSWVFPALLIYLLDAAKIGEKGLSEVDFDDLKAKFGFERAYLEKTLKAWQELGLLEFKSGDKVHLSYERIGGVLARKSFVKAQLQESLKRVESDWQNPLARFEASTLSMDPALIPQLFAEYKALIDRYISLEKSPETEAAIVQVGLQLFRVV